MASDRNHRVPAFAGMSGDLKISPNPDQQVIVELKECFLLRQKSLRARFAMVDLREMIERVEGDESDIVEIILRKRKSPKSLTVRLKIWHDRVGRIDIWNMQTDEGAATWSCEGRLAGSTIGKPLMDALDESDVALTGRNARIALKAIWARLFLGGPVGLASERL